MAKHARTGKGGIIVWDQDDWTGGLAPGWKLTAAQTLKSPSNQNRTLDQVDPFRDYGFIQPGYFPQDATNTSALANVLVSGVLYSDFVTLYGIDIGGKVHSYNWDTNVLLNSGGTFPHTITGTTPVGQNVVVYQHNSGGTTTQVNSLFYSYYNVANWDVGAYVNFTTFDDDFMSSVPTTPLDITSGDGDSVYQRTLPHSFCIGADDVLYIGSGRYLHAYDGAQGNNGTFIAQVLPLPAGFQVVGMLKYDTYMIIVGNYFANAAATTNASSGRALAYLWNYIDQDPTQIIDLGDPTVSTIFSWRGQPHVITSGSIGSRGSIHLKEIVGNSAVPRADIGSDLDPVLMGIDASTNMLYINTGGKVFTVGNRYSSEATYELNYISAVSSANKSGYIKLIPQGSVSSVNYTLIASSTDASNAAPKISKFNVSGYSTAVYRSIFEEINFPVGKQGRIVSVMPYYKGAVTQESNKNFIINIQTNFGANADVIAQNTNVLTAPFVKRYFNATSGAPFPEFQNIALYMVWQNGSVSYVDSFAVSKVVVEYEDIDLQAN